MAIDVSFAPRRLGRPGPTGARSSQRSEGEFAWAMVGAAGAAAAALLYTGDVSLLTLFVPIVLGGTFAAVVAARSSGALRRMGMTRTASRLMLLDLHERQQAQCALPSLPAGWHVETSVHAAHGDSFAGDFVLGNLRDSGELEVALVDVSGNGWSAGSRSLLVGGAFAGLLGATETRRFLPAANDYLVRQGWAEGFATALHSSINLTTGAYSIGSAGHPAAVHFHSGTGRWESVSGSSGLLLGVLGGQGAEDYPRATGQLERGDALLIYSDGVIESPGIDLYQGLDRMLGYADRAVASTMAGSAARICEASRAGEDDDRSVVVIWRD